MQTDKNNKIDVICFGGEDWWYHNRGHIDMQLMRRFARKGTTVYVNSLVMQKPNFKQGRQFLQKFKRKAKSIFNGLKRSDAGFWVYSPFSLPVHHSMLLKPVNDLLLRLQIRLIESRLRIHDPIVWVACPVACEQALKMKKSKLVYQRTDRYEDYPGIDRELIIRYDRILKQKADITVFVNAGLFEDEKNDCKRAVFLDHGVDYDMFAESDQQSQIPGDIDGIEKPIVGFYGGFASHTTDTDLLQKVVDLLPDKNFVFVGQPSGDCAVLKSKSNVRFLGQKPYDQIPSYGKCFDVALMPWKQNDWIKACNPIKLKEYLALGKPIVSTPFPELSKYQDVVYVAGNAEEFAKCINKAIEEDSDELIKARREKVKLSSWDSKAELVLESIFAEASKVK